MKAYWVPILLASAMLAAAQGGPAEAPKAEAAGAAKDEAVAAAKDEAPDPRFKDVPQQHVAGVVSIEKQNPKLVEAWLRVRHLQAEQQRLIEVFGLQKRKAAERELNNIAAQLAKELESFRKLHQRERDPLIEKEGALKDQAFRMSNKTSTGNEAKLQAEEQKLAVIYEETGKLGDQIRALDSLEVLVGKQVLPDRFDQLGISKQDTAVRAKAAEFAGLFERLLTVKDCLADIQELKAREGTPAWTAADNRSMEAAALNLEKAAADLQKEAARLKKPFEMEMEKGQKQIEALKAKIDSQAKRNRPTDELDAQLGDLEKQAADVTTLVETITGLAEWEKLKPADANKKPAADADK